MNLEPAITRVKSSNHGLKIMSMPHHIPISLKLSRSSPLQDFHSGFMAKPIRLISCAFSTYTPCLSWEKHVTRPPFAKRSEPSNKTCRTVSKSDGTKFIFPSSKYKRFKDKTGHNIRRRVLRLRARMAHHNRDLLKNWTTSRFQGTAVVGKLRKKFQVKRENIKTIPNLLTTLRMTSAPILAYLVVHDQFGLALGVFVTAGITDLLDGYIARNFKNQRTALGTALDPLADKLLVSFLTVSLTSADLIPVPMTVLILSRDAGLILASFYIRYMTLTPPRTLSRYFDVSHVTAKLHPSNISKANTALQLLYVACTLASPVFDCVGHPMLQGLMYVTATTTFLSGADYVLTWRKRIEIVKNK
ncbi:hypothetical protein EGW08_021869 [Elysia chlorotica]|uniref:cardiolipin synthase (CMP-forming) n=1 Tax=Elysia chlorotica TaxID=188477 RepID=A0A3S0Z6F6_ELYCH|nr:hypothetical protein EGW08_021869 [Elysia chlorotica]